MKKPKIQTKFLKKRNLSIKTCMLLKMWDADNSEFDIFFNNNLLTPRNEELSKKCEGTCMLSKKECHVALNKGYGQWQVT